VPKAAQNIHRLLRISSDHHVVGPLEVVSLDAAPTFYALSHCRGFKTPSCNLQPGAENLVVRPDLAAGVARIRELVLYVRIDKTCINQKDLQERSSQVQLMGEGDLSTVRQNADLARAAFTNVLPGMATGRDVTTESRK